MSSQQRGWVDHESLASNVSKVCPGAQATWPRLKAHMLKWNLNEQIHLRKVECENNLGRSPCSQQVIANSKEGIRRLSITNTTAPRLWKGQRFPQRKGCVLPLSYRIPPGHQSQARWARICPIAVHLAVQLKCNSSATLKVSKEILNTRLDHSWPKVQRPDEFSKFSQWQNICTDQASPWEGSPPIQCESRRTSAYFVEILI